MKRISKKITIIDYGLGNLFNVERAFKNIGAESVITYDTGKIAKADYLVLPGVGAFKDGMNGLNERNLIVPICDFIKTGRPLLAICLGMQLLMTESEEFGINQGMDIISGKVVKLKSDPAIKIPNIGWNHIMLPMEVDQNEYRDKFWKDTILNDIKMGASLYFVHSYVVVPDDKKCVLAETQYGPNRFCSVAKKGNVFACQFHPERSGEAGLNMLKQFLLI